MKTIQDIKSDNQPQSVTITPTMVDELVSCETITETHRGQDRIVYNYTVNRYEPHEYLAVMQLKNSELETQLTESQLALVEMYEMLLT